MKKYLTLILALPFLLCCSKEEIRNNNPYLPNYSFSFPIDISFPTYNDLRYPSAPVVITGAGAGINGIVVMYTGNSYVAFENTCPNHDVRPCSILQRNGILTKCTCDDIEYSLYDGSPTTQTRFPLKAYRVEVLNSTNIRVYN